MKKLLLAMMALGIILTGCSADTGTNGTKTLDEAKIGVIQLMQHSALDQSYEGFKEVLLDAGVKEENIKYEVAGDQSNCSTVADTLVNGGNDLIYAIATPALQAAAAATQDLPIVGCAVTDYVSTKLVASDEAPGGNITGASDLTPIEQQFDLITTLLPEAKKVAILYCSGEDNSIIQGNMAVDAAKERNLEYKVYTVSDSNDIQAVTQQIVNDQNDVIYIPTDNLLATYTSSVEAISSPAGIPIIPGWADAIGEGTAYATYGLSYYNLGKLAGEQAVAILKGEKTPANTAIGYLAAEDCELSVNLTMAKKLGLSTDKADYPANTNFVE